LEYKQELTISETVAVRINNIDIVFTVVAALVAQIQTDSMIIGALTGILTLYITGALKWREAVHLLSEGMRLMAFIGFVMITANGFAAVVTATGDINTLVGSATSILDGNKALAAMLMLVIGLLITMGIGSSFATIPIITAIFVPLAVEFRFSIIAIIKLIGTAGALGDAGSPASDSTLGPTAGLNVDGQHNHIWDTRVPTFLHTISHC
jgi:predicted histidine transporter YuiF (NhaC family)